MPHSSHRSPLPPTTPTEALVRAQLLLDYPPTADKTDEWRATIQSLISSRPAVLPRQRGAWLPRSVAVGEADEALDSGPPFVGLVRRRRIV